MHLVKLRVNNLNRSNAEQFEAMVMKMRGAEKVDTWPGRAEIQASDAIEMSKIIAELRVRGFDVMDEPPAKAADVRIAGMTCRSCEITIERKFKKIPGVRKVNVNAGRGIARIVYEGGVKPDIGALQKAIGDEKYTVRGFYESKNREGASDAAEIRPSFWRILWLFAAVLLAGKILGRFGLFDQSFSATGKTTFLGALAVGLLAGSSSCIAVSGGLLLSSAKKFRERYGDGNAAARMKPVFLFVSGRVLSYALLGGSIGVLGKALNPSPSTTGALIMFAAVYMLVMGLDMLGIAPAWLKGLMPRMPKAIGHRVLDAEHKKHPIMPAVLGAATFLLPCGFTQALQLYALSTKSFVAGATVLGGFALGTAPVLLGLGLASTSLKGKAGKLFFQFSGALVIVLGLTNIQNGLTLTGYPLRWPEFSISSGAAASDSVAAELADDPNVSFDGSRQLIKMRISGQPPYYLPSDRYTVRADMPVRMEISGYGTGCRSYFMIPQLGVKTTLDQSLNVVEFTPEKPGTYSFSCSMGMFRGFLKVVSNG